MKKQELINLKEKIEKNFYIYDAFSSEGPISMFEIEQRTNTQGAVNHVGKYFESLIQYLSNKEIKYDEITIFLQFGIFVSEKYVDEHFYRKENAKAMNDFVTISISGFDYKKDNQIHHEDPELIIENDTESFIISFNQFITLLSLNGFQLEGINSFEKISQRISSDKLASAKITINFTDKKVKKKTP